MSRPSSKTLSKSRRSSTARQRASPLDGSAWWLAGWPQRHSGSAAAGVGAPGVGAPVRGGGSERGVVVRGGRLEVADVRLAGAVARRGEELDAAGDDPVLGAPLAVLLPRLVLEAAGDGD